MDVHVIGRAGRHNARIEVMDIARNGFKNLVMVLGSPVGQPTDSGDVRLVFSRLWILA